MERLSIRGGRIAYALLFSALIAAVLAFTAAPPALAADTTDPVKADGQTVVQDGDVTVEVTSDDNKNAVQATNGSDVTVNGNVTVNDNDPEGNHSANGVMADDSTVKTENVTANGETVDAVDAVNNANVTTQDISANGNVARGVSASDSQVTSGRINVDGDHSIGVDADSDSTVTADSITAEGNYAQAANLSGEASLTVNGDVVSTGTGADGIVMGDNPTGTAVVEGDVSADSYGAVVQLISSKQWGKHGEQGSYPGSAVLVVEGDLSGDTAPLAIIPYFYTNLFGGNHYYYDLSDYETSDFPMIIVQSLSAKQNWIDAVTYTNGGQAYYLPVTDEKADALKEAVLKNVYYIVNADGFTVAGAQEITVNGKTYLVAQEGDSLTLTPIVPSGYKLASTDFGAYTVEQTEDGSYIVTAARGGNLVFTATVEEDPSNPEPNDDPEPAVDPESEDDPEPAVNPESTDDPEPAANKTIKVVNASKTAPASTTATEAAASSNAIPALGDDVPVSVWFLIIAMLSAAICAGAAYRKFEA